MVSINIIRLIIDNNTLADYAFYRLFINCQSLTTAPELPATTLIDACYEYMFCHCTSLTTAPELHATTLAYGCYMGMFQNCTSLTHAPELPATTLKTYCYGWMFDGCSNLNYTKAMFEDISADGCLAYWLNNVSQTGTFIKNKKATWNRKDANIPTGWTVQTA